MLFYLDGKYGENSREKFELCVFIINLRSLIGEQGKP